MISGCSKYLGTEVCINFAQKSYMYYESELKKTTSVHSRDTSFLLNDKVQKQGIEKLEYTLRKSTRREM